MSREQLHGAAVADLLRRFEPQIRCYLHRMVGEGGLDDVYQETITAALAAADRFEYHGDAQFMVWVYTIARRVVLQSQRKAARTPARLCSPLSSTPGVPESAIAQLGGTPSSLVARSEYCRKLAQAMNALPQAYREVVTLYKIEERPLGEVAQILGKSKSATCHLFARALAALNEKFQE